MLSIGRIAVLELSGCAQVRAKDRAHCRGSADRRAILRLEHIVDAVRAVLGAAAAHATEREFGRVLIEHRAIESTCCDRPLQTSGAIWLPG